MRPRSSTTMRSARSIVDRRCAMTIVLRPRISVSSAACTWRSTIDRKSTRLNSSHLGISYAVFCVKKELTEDDFDFLTSNKVWIATDRSRARRCVEACVYGTLDFVGYPSFPAPVEFIAAVIAYYVHPVNIQTACLIMEGS